ncbi:MAG: restriction endonuclease subunit S [Cyclobacteriaceae bacterium]
MVKTGEKTQIMVKKGRDKKGVGQGQPPIHFVPTQPAHNKPLPEGWKWVKLGEVCEKVESVKRSNQDPKKEFIYLDIGGIDNVQNRIRDHKVYKWSDAPSRAQQIVRKNDILFSTVRTYMRNIALVEGDDYDSQLASSGFCVIRTKKDVLDPRLAFYLSLSSIFLDPLNELQTGSSYPAVRDSDVFSQVIPLPPLHAQHAIVSKIEELLSELDKGKQQLETAQQQIKVYRQAVLKWAFEGRLTNENVKEGELPEGWILRPFNELGSWRGGGTPTKSRKDFWENGNIMWVSPKDMKTQVIQDTIDKITLDAVENSSTKLIPQGSILFVVRSGILRRTLPIALTVNEVTVNQDLQAFTPDNLLPEYVYWYVAAKNEDIRKNCSKDGTTVESIETVALKNYLVPVCKLNEQRMIVQRVESRLRVSDRLEETINQNLAHAETLRQSILKKAFEGKLVL